MESESFNSIDWKTIGIQNLESRPQIEGKAYSIEDLSSKANRKYRWMNKKPFYYSDTGASNQKILPGNGLFQTNSFFSAFQMAYMQHGNIALVPDEVWLVILSFISKYIEERTKKLRGKLVMHKGFKELVVRQEVSLDSSENVEENSELWEQFFDSILEQIRKNTHEGMVQMFECDFSTTSKIHKIASTVMVMNSCKNLFQYTRRICACGINNVSMAGTREDWVKLPEKLKMFSKFDTDGELVQYIEKVTPILENFILTFDEKPSLEFWNTVMKTPEMRKIYGGEEVEVEGWILHFFGIYEKHSFASFPNFDIVIPIKQINEITKKQQNLFLNANWNSVSKLDDETYKPDLSLSIHLESEKSI